MRPDAVVTPTPLSTAPLRASASVVAPISTFALLTFTARPVVAATPAVWVRLKSTATSASTLTLGADTCASDTEAVCVAGDVLRDAHAHRRADHAHGHADLGQVDFRQHIGGGLHGQRAQRAHLAIAGDARADVMRVLLVTRTPAPAPATPALAATEAVTASRFLNCVFSSASTDRLS